MRISVLLLAVGLGFALTSVETHAQGASEGFVLGAHLNGSAISTDGSDVVESGGGLSGIVGYGFTPMVGVYARLTGASIQPTSGDSYALAHFDLGMRLNLKNGSSQWVPYLNAALTGRAASFNIGGQTLDVSGSALTLGGGLQFFVNSTAAFAASLDYSFGDFTEASSGGQTVDIELGAGSTRFDLGILWYPSGS